MSIYKGDLEGSGRNDRCKKCMGRRQTLKRLLEPSVQTVILEESKLSP
jgi:hypothetical protein